MVSTKSTGITREEMQSLDQQAIQQFGIPGLILMENAGRGAADIIYRKFSKGKVTILCGKGNNGGDGFVVARHLYNNGYNVEVIFFGDPEKINLHSDAGINWHILQKMNIPCCCTTTNINHNQCDFIVDAIFGIGLQGSIRSPFPHIFDQINSWQKPTVAIDIPSGLDANTGKILGSALPAQTTITFGKPKQGLYINDGAKISGDIHIVDISLPQIR